VNLPATPERAGAQGVPQERGSMPPEPVEMTGDAGFRRRVVRLAVTSAVALGAVWFLWATTVEGHPAVGAGLLAGWLLMPAVLGLSLRWPKIRYAVAVPSALVSLSLVAVCGLFLPESGVARAGWILLTVGVLLGAGMGAWFWYRWIPVPASWSRPFSPGRWLLVGVHLGLVGGGIALITAAALAWPKL